MGNGGCRSKCCFYSPPVDENEQTAEMKYTTEGEADTEVGLEADGNAVAAQGAGKGTVHRKARMSSKSEVIIADPT